MNTLEKKLAERADKTTGDNESLVSEAKLLLSSNAADERNTLRSIGLDNDIQYIEEKQQDLMIRKSHGAKLDSQILHISEINGFCLDYRLYMRPAREFIGIIPTTLGADLHRFCKEKNIPLGAHNDYSSFLVIAPPKMFKGYQNFGKTMAEGANLQLEERRTRLEEEKRRREERERLSRMDPILVYKLQEPGYYAVIKSWGNDFSTLRRVYGTLTRTFSVKILNFLANLLIVFAAFKLSMWQYGLLRSMTTVVDGEIKDGMAWVVLGVVLSGLIAVLTMIWLSSKDTVEFRKYIVARITYNENNIRNDRQDKGFEAPKRSKSTTSWSD